MKQKVKYLDAKITRLILIAIVFMSIGLSIELYLLKHYEGILQFIPIICVSLGLILSLILFKFRNSSIQILFHISLILMVASGLAGIFLHLKANYEFEKEIRPSINGMDLFMESLSGALPSLAPGSLILLALIGYSYTLLIKQQQ